MEIQNSPKKKYFPPMHTAEHILNRTMVNMFGCERSENCHIERKKSKCDFVLNEKPTDQQIAQIEAKVNEIIQKNLPVTEKLITYSEASKKYKLRVPEDENPVIRIISIGDYDDCPCIGEHVSNTSEIGTFKLLTNTFENNIFRLRFKVISPEN